MMVFKVDFEKAYNLLSLDYLLEIFHIMGFGLTWCGWIRAVLTSAKASVLFNGFPTSEFDI